MHCSKVNKQYVQEQCSSHDDCLSGFCHEEMCQKEIKTESEFTELRNKYAEEFNKSCSTYNDCKTISVRDPRSLKIYGNEKNTRITMKWVSNNFCLPSQKKAWSACLKGNECASNNCFENRCRKIDSNSMI